jgi:hypothetical protein
MAGLAGQKADIDSVTQADNEARAKAEEILRKNNR